MDHIQGEVDWHSYLADISAEELHSIIDIMFFRQQFANGGTGESFLW